MEREQQPCLFCGGSHPPGDHRACDGRQGRMEASLPLPHFVPETHARTTDPDTSLAAALAVDATEMQQRVYAIHQEHPEGLTDEELLLHYGRRYTLAGRSQESHMSPRKRRSDLATARILVDSGLRRPLVSGRNGVVWRIATPEERRRYAEETSRDALAVTT